MERAPPMDQQAQPGLFDRAPRERAPQPVRNGSPESGEPSVQQLSGRGLRGVALLAVVTVIVARLVAPALPGSRAGITRWIVRADVLANFLSQIWVVLGVLIAFRLVVATLRDRTLRVGHRVLAAPAAAAALTLIMAAAERGLSPGLSLTLAVLTSLVALAAAPATLAKPSTRALGIVIAAAGLSAFLHLLCRVLAMRASDEALASLFHTAQGLATLGFLLNLGGAAVVAVWLGARRPRTVAVALVVLVAIAVLGSWGAMRGSGEGATLWQVLASRGLNELSRNPAPFVPAFLRHAEELWLLLVALAVLVPRRGPGLVQAGFALALVGQSSADVPAAALILLLAALLAPLAADSSAMPRARLGQRADDERAEHEHEIGHRSEEQ
jgi:hypothetical protein